MSINFVDLEEKVFLDKKVRSKFPHFNQLFFQYDLSRKSPALKQLGRRTIHQFVRELRDTDKDLLKAILNEDIAFIELDENISANIECDIASLESNLYDLGLSGNMSISRIGSKVFLTCWK